MRFPPSRFLPGAAATLTLVVSGLGAPTSVDNDGPKTFSAIVAFGDSFSDNGPSLVYRFCVLRAESRPVALGSGAWAISNHTWPADPH